MYVIQHVSDVCKNRLVPFCLSVICCVHLRGSIKSGSTEYNIPKQLKTLCIHWKKNTKAPTHNVMFICPYEQQ